MMSERAMRRREWARGEAASVATTAAAAVAAAATTATATAAAAAAEADRGRHGGGQSLRVFRHQWLSTVQYVVVE